MKLFQISDLRHITCSVPGAGGQPYGGKRLLWESGMGGVGISGSCCLTFEFASIFPFLPEAECISPEDGWCFTGLDIKYLDGGQESKCTVIENLTKQV